jgi:hypothetical protein
MSDQNQNDIYSSENMDIFTDNGEFITSLNRRLVIKQGLTAEEIELLKDTHVVRRILFNCMEATDDAIHLRRFAKVFEELENCQQELWKFGANKSFHRWFEVPKCSCPKLDNQDCLGSEVDVVDLTCKIHGGGRNVK